MAVSGEEVESSSGSHSTRPDPGPAGGHYLAKCVLKGSAVIHAVSGHIRSPSTLDVVFGKETSLELVVIGDDGIVQSLCEQTVFGIIKDIAVLRWNEKVRESTPQMHGKDLLVVLSDSGKLSFLGFCSDMRRFFAITHVQLSPPGNPRFQLGRMLAVDPDGCFVAVSAYDDLFALLPVSKAAGSNIVEEKISYPAEETSAVRDTSRTNMCGTIWSICFLSNVTCSGNEGYNPLLAIIMHRKGNSRNELFLFECNPRTRCICLVSQYSDTGPLLYDISAIPHLPGFVLLFRMGDVLLVDYRNPHNICSFNRLNFNLPCGVEEQSSAEEPCRGLDVDDEGMSNVAASALLELRDSGNDMVTNDDPMNIDTISAKVAYTSNYVVSWSWEPSISTSSKLIICLDTGELHIIDFYSGIEAFEFSLSECLYNSLPCKMLLWFNNGMFAGFVDMGDGFVLMLEHGRLVYKSSIQNIAPILDLSVDDYHDEKQDQMFACCGMAPEGSIRLIRRGVSVEKLLRTAPIYQGVTGTWTLRMKENDPYHSFLVLSFVEETRVLSVGLSFTDITDASGFQPDACTLACGLVADGLLVQIHKAEVRLCLPTTCAHPEGISCSEPICTSWHPENLSISLGAVGCNFIIVATSNPCLLFLLGVRSQSPYHYEIYEIQHVKLQNEVSCMSIPRESVNHDILPSKVKVSDKDHQPSPQTKVEMGLTFVIGTHKPDIEVLSFVPEKELRVLAIGTITVNNALGTPLSGCIPEDVRLVFVDRFYILSGLRNGMILRYEWPATPPVAMSEQSRKNSQYDATYISKMSTSSPCTAVPYPFGNLMKAENCRPIFLQLVAIRRIGIAPAVLVPIHDFLDADIIVLSDRPWLLHSARHSLAYSSMSFQPATHVTPVASGDCPKGIIFVAENCLHLVEMAHTKRLNVHKFSIGGTPRKVLYHKESRTLLVMRTGLADPRSSDICRVDPLSGTMLQKFHCEPGETAKCMQLIKVGSEEVLVVGTSLFAGRAIMPSGEAESAKGRLIVLSLEIPRLSSDSGMFCTSSFSPYGSQGCSPFSEIVGCANEQLSSSRPSGSPDDMSSDIVIIEETNVANLRLIFQVQLPGVVHSLCPYLDRYFLASAGNAVNLFGFLNENPQRPRKFATAKTRFTVTCLASYYTRIAVGDCRDGILFYSYDEDHRKLEQWYSDPVQRLVGDCALMDMETVIVSDRRGSISVLSCTNHLEGNESPEKNLTINCSFYLGETVMSIKKGSFSYKLPLNVTTGIYNGAGEDLESTCNNIVATTLLGSVLILIPVTRKESELLRAVEDRLVVHPLTCPILGNDQKEFRGRVPQRGGPTMLDGDMLAQFLELTCMQQEAVLASPPGLLSSRALMSDTCGLPSPPISVSEVVKVLERVHYALN